MSNYIPFKYSSVTRPTNNIIYENLDHLNWKKSNNTISVNNLITDLPENAKLIQNNDDCFVVNVPNDSILDILSKYHEIILNRLTVSVLKEEFLFTEQRVFKNEFLQHLNQLCEYNKVSIIITNYQPDIFDINMVGYPDNIKIAESKLRLFIDQMNPIIYIDYLELGTISLLPLIGGIEFNNFKQVAKQTNCHLYLPNIFPESYESNLPTDSRIYISGLKSQVLLTKNLISKIKENITSPFIKNVPLDLNKKTILLLLHKQEKIINIMYKNECFIQFPRLGSNESVILFQANNLDAIEKSIEQFVKLLNEVYCVVWESNSSIVKEQDSAIIDMCSYANCMVQVTDNKMTTTGLRSDVKKFMTLMNNNQTFVQQINCVRNSLELNNEERDFIGGKKNGKLLKIMNNSNSIVKIIPYSDFSFIVELNSQTIKDSIVGLTMIEDELPTSITFNIPESFHRQIIGVGGATVQTIMRRYNVFIKFSNTFTFNGTEDLDKIDYNPIQSFIRKSNVIIKCPAKNSNNIPYAKLELEKLVQNCSNVCYFNTFIKLSRSHWRLLSNNSIGINNEIKNLSKNASNSTFITDLEKTTNTLIKFPEIEPISLELLEIKGVEKNSEQCANLFAKLLPRDYEFKLAFNPIFAELSSFDRNSRHLLQTSDNSIGYKFLNEILVPFKLLYNIEVQVFYNPKLENDEEDLFNNTTQQQQTEGHYKSSSLSSASGRNFINNIKNHSPLSPNFEFYSLQNMDKKEVPQFHSIILSYFEEEVNKINLDKCLDILTTFLRDNKIIIIDKNFNDNKNYIIDGSSITNSNLELNKENINDTQFAPMQQFPIQQQYYPQQQQQQQQQNKFMTNSDMPMQNNQSWGYFQ